MAVAHARSNTDPPIAWEVPSQLSDSVNLTRAPGFAIRSNVAGTLKVTHADGTASLMNFTAGESRPAKILRVWSTGTVAITAADLEIAYHE